MIDVLMAIWNFLAGFWGSLPESKKNEIKEKVADAMEEKLRRYYAAAKEQAGTA